MQTGRRKQVSANASKRRVAGRDAVSKKRRDRTVQWVLVPEIAVTRLFRLADAVTQEAGALHAEVVTTVQAEVARLDRAVQAWFDCIDALVNVGVATVVAKRKRVRRSTRLLGIARVEIAVQATERSPAVTSALRLLDHAQRQNAIFRVQAANELSTVDWREWWKKFKASRLPKQKAARQPVINGFGGLPDDAKPHDSEEIPERNARGLTVDGEFFLKHAGIEKWPCTESELERRRKIVLRQFHPDHAGASATELFQKAMRGYAELIEQLRVEPKISAAYSSVVHEWPPREGLHV